jgi:glycosyltransferase involved in cell wall biosynthesis
MEVFTLGLLEQLHRQGLPGGTWRHLDTSVSKRIDERERFTVRKALIVLGQAARSAWLAANGYDAYAPVSQNRIGLLRDLVLLAPFRLARRRIVIHLNGGALDEVLAAQPWWLQRGLRWLLGRDDARGIVVAAALRRCLEPLLPSGRIFVVHNPVEDMGTAAEKPSQPPLRVLFVGTIMRTKGYRELVEAVVTLVDDGVPVTLELAGRPYTADDARRIAAVSHPAVTWLGHLAGTAKLAAFSRAHVVAQPSTAPEGQPLTILEAMAASCAVVATSWPGIGATVGAGEAILLPATGGAPLTSALEAALRELAEDRARTVALGRAARVRYEREYTPELFFEGWLRAVL